MKFPHQFIVGIEVDTVLRGGNFHQESLKLRVFADIGGDMVKVDVLFRQNRLVSLGKVLQGNRLRFRNVHLLGEYLREAVDEERLACCLPI